MSPKKPQKMVRQFKKVLIANRGEIAVRITQTLQEMGITAAVLYSDVDRNAKHVQVADEAYHLPGITAAETYLQTERILALCKANGVDAVHPGYGFLSENASFAEACEQADIRFIGPDVQTIRAMGDKIIAKTMMAKAGVPVVPGWSSDALTADNVDLSSKKLLEMAACEAQNMGYPVLVKAAAGGGGKGMRRVNTPEKLPEAFISAAREAGNAFGDARIFLEKYIEHPRHIEFQIFGDTHGNVVHLFERECSIQRRHQKIIEESPAPGMSAELREAMSSAAVNAAKALNYTNAGTVEFIVDADDNFYFLEVNTRLQVEHPVTEMVTRQNLVWAQVLVAQGECLPFAQNELCQSGHAIECRVYAEDPGRQFLPSTGRLQHYIAPKGPNIRVDSGVLCGSEVTVHYDPMLSKLIVWGANRDAALEKMRWALARYVLLGVTTNIPFLAAVVAHPAFISADLTTSFLERHDVLNPLNKMFEEMPKEALLAATLFQGGGSSEISSVTDSVQSERTPWQTLGSWRVV